MGFVVDKVALRQVFLRAVQFSPVSIILPMLQSDSCIYHQLYTISAMDSIVK